MYHHVVVPNYYQRPQNNIWPFAVPPMAPPMTFLVPISYPSYPPLPYNPPQQVPLLPRPIPTYHPVYPTSFDSSNQDRYSSSSSNFDSGLSMDTTDSTIDEDVSIGLPSDSDEDGTDMNETTPMYYDCETDELNVAFDDGEHQDEEIDVVNVEPPTTPEERDLLEILYLNGMPPLLAETDEMLRRSRSV